MPYTPPSLSPAASPAQSRSASISFHDRPSISSITPPPPRSTSHLQQKYRRNSHSNAISGRSQSGRQSTGIRSGSLHQSPLPVNNNSFIPPGALVSPPDSKENSSDDDEAPIEMRRGRQVENLDELREAIKILPQRRVPSPDNSAKRTSPSDLQVTSSRRFGHSRSSSESSFLKGFKSNPDSDVEDEGYRATPMVRKKSGELVKSSLKTPNRSRPCSVPSTPTFPKAVHFDQHLEYVRHFSNTEKPAAVSAGSSPVELFDGDGFPFDDDEIYLSPPFEWDIELPNFPKDPNTRKHLPVRVERAYLSTDKQSLLGTVAVQNLAFQKQVYVRFTLDYWSTVSEVTAEFNNDIRRKQREENVDRFTFKIKLSDLTNLESKTLFFCVRYCVAGQELWDNNNQMNFQVDFKKMFLPQNGKPSAVRMSLPRSRPAAASLPRTMSMPNLDKFNSYPDVESLTIQIEKPVPKQSIVISEGAEAVRRANPSGNALSNRYDFGASFATLGSTNGGKPEDGAFFKFTSGESAPQKAAELPVAAPLPKAVMETPAKPVVAGSPEMLIAGEKPSIESLSYRELLETYCFFGTAKTSPPHPTILDTPVNQDYTHNHPILSAYTLGGSNSPSPPRSPLLELAQSPRYTPPNDSPPSLTGSQRSSASSSPVPFGTYKYQPRRNHGGFAFDTPQATAIRG